MNAFRVYAPPALLATGAGLVALVLVLATFALGAAYRDLREDRERLADLQQRAAVVDDLKTLIAQAKATDPSGAGFLTAPDQQQLSALMQNKVSEAILAEKGQIVAVNALESTDDSDVLSMRIEMNFTLPRDRLEALIGALEFGQKPIFFENLRLDPRQAEQTGMLQIQTQLRAFGVISVLP